MPRRASRPPKTSRCRQAREAKTFSATCPMDCQVSDRHIRRRFPMCWTEDGSQPRSHNTERPIRIIRDYRILTVLDTIYDDRHILFNMTVVIDRKGAVA